MSRYRGGATYKEGDEDCSVHENQGQESGPAISKTSGDRSSEEDTDKGATLAGLEERTLPLGGNRVSGSLDEDSVSLLEGGERNEVTVQEHVEGLHDLVDVRCHSVQLCCILS